MIVVCSLQSAVPLLTLKSAINIRKETSPNSFKFGSILCIFLMEITSSNDGLLTNIEVFDLIESRRLQRKDNHPIAIELQNRERIEMQVALFATHNTLALDDSISARNDRKD